MKNLYDEVLERTLKRVEAVAERLSIKFKGIQPFDTEPIPKKELLQYYNGLTLKDMEELVATHGRDKVNDFISEVEGLKQRG